MDDLIPRSAVIDLIDKYTQNMATDYWGTNYGIPSGVFEDEIMDLPSAQPKRMPGKWIPVTNGRGGHEYSLCHSYAPSYKSGDEWLTDYCPCCGSDNRGERDD